MHLLRLLSFTAYFIFFFFNDTATTEIYTLSLHDALPIERCWGILEMHWNGSLLDSVEAVLGFARSMTWKGKHPVVRMVETVYATGVKLKPKEMKALESEVVRLAGLGKWFVKIPAQVRDG